MDFDELDPEDPKIDEKVTKVLVAKVKELIYEARERFELAKENSENHRQTKGVDDEDLLPDFKLEAPNRVLVRLKVEHTGFSTLNNQR